MSADQDALRQQFEKKYGREYSEFLAADEVASRICPRCRTETLRKLWLGEPNTKMGDSVWGKWYLWCETCLTGIYCPFGTHQVPIGETYISWGDEAALKKALPAGLRLIRPDTELKSNG
jgi:hypothetical protein